ncbi:hypothetical protein PYR74_13930 [Acinetobacter bereziniae]|nr:hypothetical protein PYR74_13930 [Acinetobacter bereziniae]
MQEKINHQSMADIFQNNFDLLLAWKHNQTPGIAKNAKRKLSAQLPAKPNVKKTIKTGKSR